MTREEAKEKAYKEAGHNAYFGNGFEAGVNYAVNVLEKRAELLYQLSNGDVGEEYRAYYTHQYNILNQMINKLKPTDK